MICPLIVYLRWNKNFILTIYQALSRLIRKSWSWEAWDGWEENIGRHGICEGSHRGHNRGWWCWSLRPLLILDFSCVIFTFTHTLCGSCIISEDYHNEITAPVWIRDMLFPKSIDIIVCDDFRIFFLTLDHSRVVVPFYLPSWDSSIILEDLLISSSVLIRPWNGWKKDVGYSGTHSHLYFLVLFSHLYSYPLWSYIISEDYS